MVKRSAERLLVSEEELARAIDVVEDELHARNIRADIDVVLQTDPDDINSDDRNCIVARVREPVGMERLLDAIPAVGSRLRTAGLLSPRLPLAFDLKPAW